MTALLALGVGFVLALPRLELWLDRRHQRQQLDRELRRLGFRPVNRGWQRLDLGPALRRECAPWR